MEARVFGRGLAMMGLVIALAGCNPDAAPSPDVPTADPDAASAAAPHVEMRDVLETGDGYIIGISYPRSVAEHPRLAAELVEYAEAARANLMEALPAAGNAGASSGPYDLSLTFVELEGTPDVVAVAADGSSYLGGAHGEPLVRRFVWLPEHGRMLTAADLVQDPSGWEAISRYVRNSLVEAAATRMEENRIAPEDRDEMQRNAGSMIEQGTEPEPENFSEFEPITDGGGKLAGLRFVFPPYQVGPYSDGTQAVEVPAEVLLPHVSADYKELFTHRD